MKTPHPLLHVEIFEDRLLPSTVLSVYNPTTDSPVAAPLFADWASVWHQHVDTTNTTQAAHTSPFTPTINPHSVETLADAGTPNAVTWPSGFTAQSIPGNGGNELKTAGANPDTAWAANTPNTAWAANRIELAQPSEQPGLATADQLVIHPLASTGPSELQPGKDWTATSSSNFVDEFHGVISLDGGRQPLWLTNRDNPNWDLSPFEGPNLPASLQARASDASALPESSNTSNDTSNAPPSSPADGGPNFGLTSFLLQTTSAPQSPVGQVSSSEQQIATEPHLVSEITLAAVSQLVPPVGSMSSVPATLPPVYPTSSLEVNLPLAVVDRSPIRAKVVRAAALVETYSSELASTASVEIQAAPGIPVAGAFGLDAAELDGSISRVFSTISTIGRDLVEELEQPETYSWLAAAGLLTLGAGYAAWSNRGIKQANAFPTGRGSLSTWQTEENNVRNG
jgi:hypothetical protein